MAGGPVAGLRFDSGGEASAGRYLLDDGTVPGLIAYAIAGARDMLKVGGLYDQMQIASGSDASRL